MSTGCHICFRTDKEVRTRLYKGTLYRNFFAAFITKWMPSNIRLCTLCVNIIQQMMEFRKQAKLVDFVLRRNIYAESSSNNGQVCSHTEHKSIHNLSIKKLDNIDIVFSIEKPNEKTKECQKYLKEHDISNDVCSNVDEKDGKNYILLKNQVKVNNRKKSVTKQRILTNNALDNDFEENNYCEVIFVSSKNEHDTNVNTKNNEPKEGDEIKNTFIIETSDNKNNGFVKHDQSESDVIAKNIDKCEGRFEKDGFKVVYLTREEQLQEIEDRKKAQSYVGRKFRCESCGLGFLTEDVMANHMTKHSQKSGNFECDICIQRFSTGAVLTQHVLAHRRYLQCIYCLTKLRRPWHCSVHRSKCDVVRKTLVCEYCKKLYSNEHSLNRHLKCVHYNEKKFTCDVCKKSFTNKQRLSLHIRTHTGQRPFECPTCVRRFATNSNLNEHIRSVHSETKDRYYCVECNAHFKMAKSLKRHFMMSSKHAGDGVTKFECQKCLKYFQSERSLQSHDNQIHLKMSPYKCGVCNKILSTSSNLRKHERNVHDMKTGGCN